MNDWILLPIILIAIASGWYFGRRERKGSRYYELGLRHLLNDEPDRAVATLVTELNVDNDNIDTIGRIILKSDNNTIEKMLNIVCP